MLKPLSFSALYKASANNRMRLIPLRALAFQQMHARSAIQLEVPADCGWRLQYFPRVGDFAAYLLLTGFM